PRYRTRAAHTAESITSTSSPAALVDALTRCSASSGGNSARIRSVVVLRRSASRPSSASRPVPSTSASFFGDLSVILRERSPFVTEKLEPDRVSRHPTRTHQGKPSERAGRKATDLKEIFPTIAGLPNGHE